MGQPGVALGCWYDEADTRWVKMAVVVVVVAVAVAEQVSVVLPRILLLGRARPRSAWAA